MSFSKDKFLKLAKGFHLRGKNCYRIAKPRVEKALQKAYKGRKLKKRDFRSTWITQINAGVREHGLNYSTFIRGLMLRNIHLNRKMLAELAISEPYSFRALATIVGEMNLYRRPTPVEGKVPFPPPGYEKQVSPISRVPGELRNVLMDLEKGLPPVGKHITPGSYVQEKSTAPPPPPTAGAAAPQTKPSQAKSAQDQAKGKTPPADKGAKDKGKAGDTTSKGGDAGGKGKAPSGGGKKS